MLADYKWFCFPVLQLMSDKKTRKRSEIVEFIAKNVKDEDKQATIKRGRPVYLNRIDWAISYLSYNSKLDDNNRLLKRVSYATYEITKLGLKLASDYEKFKDWFLKVYNINIETTQIIQTPDENLEKNFDDLNEELKSSILREILNKEPRFFEALVLVLFEKMGYGISGALTNNGTDGGIDGIISEDVFGFSKIYIQAKRYDKGKIGRPVIQQFAGALSDKITQKGIFITTSKFTDDAINFVKNHQKYSIVLIDGMQLCELMIKYKVGVQVKEIKEICRLDVDFFDGLEHEI